MGRAFRRHPATELPWRRIAGLRRRGRTVRRTQYQLYRKRRVQEVHAARLDQLHADARSQFVRQLFQGLQGRRFRSARGRSERAGGRPRQPDRRGNHRFPQFRTRRGRQLRSRLQGPLRRRTLECRTGRILRRLHGRSDSRVGRLRSRRAADVLRCGVQCRRRHIQGYRGGGVHAPGCVRSLRIAGIHRRAV